MMRIENQKSADGFSPKKMFNLQVIDSPNLCMSSCQIILEITKLQQIIVRQTEVQT